jgi:hypothetical protein
MTIRADYTPPSCSFNDELETYAVRREVVRIRFRDPEERSGRCCGPLPTSGRRAAPNTSAPATERRSGWTV